MNYVDPLSSGVGSTAPKKDVGVMFGQHKVDKGREFFWGMGDDGEDRELNPDSVWRARRIMNESRDDTWELTGVAKDEHSGEPEVVVITSHDVERQDELDDEANHRHGERTLPYHGEYGNLLNYVAFVQSPRVAKCAPPVLLVDEDPWAYGVESDGWNIDREIGERIRVYVNLNARSIPEGYRIETKA